MAGIQQIRPSTALLWLAFLTYVLIGLAGVFQHEMWLDEAHHWLVARDSSSLPELFRNLRYEGHPGLWNLLLYGLKYIHDGPLTAQLLNFSFAAGMVALVVFLSPFPVWARVLFPFGYFPLFEYGMISRNYALAGFLAFGFVYLYTRRRASWLVLSIVLASLANTHFLGLVLSLLLAVWVVLERKEGKLQALWSPLFIFLIGAGIALVQIIPPAAHPILADLDAGRMAGPERLKRIALVGWESFFPIPRLDTLHFWNTNYLVFRQASWARWLSLVMLLMPLWFFRKCPKAWLAFYGTVLAVLLLSTFRNVNYARFHGFIFLAFLIALWMEWEKRQTPLPAAKALALAVILVAQVAGGYVAFSKDYRYPFSQGKNTARYLDKELKPQAPIIANYCFGESLNAYSRAFRIVYPERPGDPFCRWQIFDPAYMAYLSTTDPYDHLIANILAAGAAEVVWVHYQKLDTGSEPLTRVIGGRRYRLAIEPLAFFEPSIKQMENYYLYRVRLSSVPVD